MHVCVLECLAVCVLGACALGVSCACVCTRVSSSVCAGCLCTECQLGHSLLGVVSCETHFSGLHREEVQAIPDGNVLQLRLIRSCHHLQSVLTCRCLYME